METQIRRINGFESCRLLRADVATRLVRIVVVTTAATAADRVRATTAGADAVLTKPCSYEDVVAVARELLDRPAAAAQAFAAIEDPEPKHSVAGVAIRQRSGSRSFHRERSTTPPRQPPTLHCPCCDTILNYDHSFIGGVNARSSEQWDYFVCRRCGPYQYRHRTKALKRTT